MYDGRGRGRGTCTGNAADVAVHNRSCTQGETCNELSLGVRVKVK